MTECGDGVHPKESCQWGDWLRVPFMPLMVGREDRGGRGRARGRGRGRGGGRGDSEDDQSNYMDTTGEDEIDGDGSGRVAMQVSLLENSGHNDNPISPLKDVTPLC